jgi:hypothetical protein
VARPSASIVVEEGAKYGTLMRLSMTTKMESKPFEFTRPVIKSIQISHQQNSGIGSG